MTTANGREYLAIPGPSVMPDRVLAAMHRAAPNIYEGDLIDLTRGLVPDLAAVARTTGRTAIYIANGHGAWEAAAANVLGDGDMALVLATGGFAKGWGEMASGLGAEVEVMDFGLRAPVDATRVAERLAADRGHRIKAVMMVHVDTGTSVRNDVSAVRAALDEAGHPALLMVDCIASMGCDRYEMDAWGVDVTVAACQKGLMTPPGLGFVWFNDKAADMRRKMRRVSVHWDWTLRADPQIFSHYWNGTAPTHHLFALREALDMIGEEGLEAIWARHGLMARTYWAAFDAWADGERGLQMNVAGAAHRSHAVTAMRLPSPQATALRDWVFERAGVTLGIGLGMAPLGDPAWHGFFRVGHMGHLNAHMVLGVIGAIGAGLEALGIPHRKGGFEAAAATVAAGA